ncbi:MAG: N-acetyltransferase [Chitinophagaceae bacterium]
MNIITKFTVASGHEMGVLLMLTRELAIEKFSSLLEQKILDRYITGNFSEQALIAEVNSMSNQWLVVYADDVPAGYARITSKGKRPQVLERKRAIRIADLGVLNKYPDPAIKNSLLEKCIAVCKAYENTWINEYTGNPLIDLFESKGFIRQEGTYESDELPLASVCLIA